MWEWVHLCHPPLLYHLTETYETNGPHESHKFSCCSCIQQTKQFSGRFLFLLSNFAIAFHKQVVLLLVHSSPVFVLLLEAGLDEKGNVSIMFMPQEPSSRRQRRWIFVWQTSQFRRWIPGYQVLRVTLLHLQECITPVNEWDLRRILCINECALFTNNSR